MVNAKEKVHLSSEKKEILLGKTKEIYRAASHLHQLIEKDMLNSEMSNGLVFLMENAFVKTSQELDYGSYLEDEQENRLREIRAANERIRNLKQQLSSKNPIDGLQEQLKGLFSKVQDWWDEEGFCYISEGHFSKDSGLDLKFDFMLDSSSSKYRRKKKAEIKNESEPYSHMDYLKEYGFEFAEQESDSTYQKHLIDNEKNRELLEKMMTTRFPSIEVYSIINRKSLDSGNFLIWSVEATIYDFKDI